MAHFSDWIFDVPFKLKLREEHQARYEEVRVRLLEKMHRRGRGTRKKDKG